MSPEVVTLRWIGDRSGRLMLIDQTLLPVEFREVDCRDVATVWEAIKMLRVRGAPAIGISAAYGVVIGLQSGHDGSPPGAQRRLREVCDNLATSRPTAVNLFWALDRMRRIGESEPTASAAQLADRLLAEARQIEAEDREICRAIGRNGATLVSDGAGILTHCNAGGLATADYGTALAVFFAMHEAGRKLSVYADETRPLLQGARLTSWELARRGIDVTLICDNMAAQVMREGRVQAAIVGADRITANGDTANKIGTYGVALLCQAHGLPFYVAAPASTFDFSLATGEQIPIEQRDPKEITHGFGRQTAPDGIKVYNPAFDVTPARLITAFITEAGIIRPPFDENLGRLLKPLVAGRPSS